MTTALWLVVYGGALTWGAPVLLGRLTASGLSPRMGVAAWLTAIATAMLTWALALILIADAAVHGVTDSSAVTLCLELFGFPEHTPLPGRIGALTLIVGGMAASAVVIARVRRSLRHLRSRSHEHAQAARLVGRCTDRSYVVVVDAPQRTAYCVLGRPNAIVVTSAALSSLSHCQLAAVLAHEDAHIRGRHHHLLMVLRALASTLPWLPLLRRGRLAVGELLEMCADDAAARQCGTPPLLSGLLTLAGSGPAPADGLAAATTAVVSRALRLADPAGPTQQWKQRIVLTTIMVGTVSAPLFINLLCHH